MDMPASKLRVLAQEWEARLRNRLRTIDQCEHIHARIRHANRRDTNDAEDGWVAVGHDDHESVVERQRTRQPDGAPPTRLLRGDHSTEKLRTFLQLRVFWHILTDYMS